MALLDRAEIARVKSQTWDPANPTSLLGKRPEACIRFYHGTVENNKDPEKLGRVKVQFQLFGDRTVSDWAPLVKPFSGKTTGFWALPEVGELVVCAFLNDSPSYPVVMGCLYHPKAKPPVKDQSKNNQKTIRTREGSEILLDDTEGKERLIVSLKSGKMKLELDKKKGISIVNDLGDINIRCKKLSVDAMDAQMETRKTLLYSAGGGIDMDAKAPLGLKASKNVVLKGKKAELKGVVLAQGRPAAKQNDMVVGTDIHMIDIPSPAGPIPTPLPHPFLGKIQDKVSKNVKIKGKPVAFMGSVAKHNPPGHIPMGPKFTKNPKNEGKVQLGTVPVVKVNGKDIAVMGSIVMTCSDPTDMPTGSVIAIP